MRSDLALAGNSDMDQIGSNGDLTATVPAPLDQSPHSLHMKKRKLSVGERRNVAVARVDENVRVGASREDKGETIDVDDAMRAVPTASATSGVEQTNHAIRIGSIIIPEDVKEGVEV